MNKIVLSLMVLLNVLFMVSCGNDSENQVKETPTGLVEVDEDQFLKDLADLETKINVDMPEKEDLKKAVTMFQDYAGLFPDEKAAPDYLLKASDIAKTLEQYSKSVKILGRIIDEYPAYEKMESVYYNRASHTDFELRDTTLAKQYYQEFMEKYPNSDFVDDAQARIDQNFMSMEELIEMWTKNPVEQ